MIRTAMPEDLPAIERVYASARAFMAAHGNPHQWCDYGYPEHELLVDDIEKRQLYVICENGAVHGVFAFIRGEDPTYRVITEGAWPNDKPYGTLHRVASDGALKGVFAKAFQFALARTDEIRVDTHRDNLPMQRAVERQGFVHCGVIFLPSGDPRIAYQFSKGTDERNENR